MTGRTILLFSVLLLVSACGPRADQAPDLAQLQARWEQSVPADAPNVQVGTALAGSAAGAAYLAARHATGDTRIRPLLDSLRVAHTGAAARLAVALMQQATGENRLDYEAVVLNLGAEAVPPLLESLAAEARWENAVHLLDALGKLRAGSAVGLVSARLADPEPWVRIAAAHALGEIGGPGAADFLAAALSDSVDTVVAAALIGLGRTGRAEDAEDCARFLRHPNPRVRSAAVSALGRIAPPDLAGRLQPMLRDPDEGVRHKALRALEGR